MRRRRPNKKCPTRPPAARRPTIYLPISSSRSAVEAFEPLPTDCSCKSRKLSGRRGTREGLLLGGKRPRYKLSLWDSFTTLTLGKAWGVNGPCDCARYKPWLPLPAHEMVRSDVLPSLGVWRRKRWRCERVLLGLGLVMMMSALCDKV
ncbi:hypothetical protein DM02DRAFT_616226 [Periconia macrospinosa]|uniref:Uncharacterized protein n=1 Tax=Periconia macrospinosa TaxID=97972 RepID=A0A2V1DJ01_9PLEO|nr:hypothetical protein DM02DRAFT_616226 [Periconia macrospinosa]